MTPKYHEALLNLNYTIRDVISPLISGNVHLTNLPYHNNMGDALIWQGSEDFIVSTGKKILSRTSFRSFTFPKIKHDEVIILNGGGSFGDIWRIIMDFFLQVISYYPNNRIILFPQSVFYENNGLLKEDAKILATHKDLHLIARDEYSYNIFSTYFNKNHVYLAPDMAFAINPERLTKWLPVKCQENTSLYLRRVDKEWDPNTEISLSGAVVSDWPAISTPTFSEKLYNLVVNKTMYSYPHNSLLDIVYWKPLDYISRAHVLRKYLDRASAFLSPFSRIITTRLHVLILGCLLDKNIEFIDNSSKKLSAFVKTWLTDFPNIRPYDLDQTVSCSSRL